MITFLAILFVVVACVLIYFIGNLFIKSFKEGLPKEAASSFSGVLLGVILLTLFALWCYGTMLTFNKGFNFLIS